MDILLAYIVESFDRSTKVVDFHYPNELLQRNNWELSDEPESLDDILISCRATLKYAIKTGRAWRGSRDQAGSHQKNCECRIFCFKILFMLIFMREMEEINVGLMTCD